MADSTLSAIVQFLGGLPDDYLILDLETNGLAPEDPATLCTQVGLARVASRQLVATEGYLVDWGKDGQLVEPEWWYDSVDETARRMRERHGHFGIDADRLVREGRHPGALAELDAVLRAAAETRLPIVGQNIHYFDRPIIDRCLAAVCGDAAARIDPECLVDTGMIAKAVFCGVAAPAAGAGYRSAWYRQISGLRRKGVKWNLQVCAEAFAGREHGLDFTQAHDASFDCVVCHHVLEGMRRRLEPPEAVARMRAAV